MIPPPSEATYHSPGLAAPDIAELIFAYRKDGIAVIPAVLEPAGVAACLSHLDYLQVSQRQTGPIVTALPNGDDFLARVTADSGLTGIAGSLLGEDAVPFGYTYVIKEPHSGLPVRWHQDGHPWRTALGIREAVTLWVALDRSDEDSGGLRVIPGSHRLAALPLRPHDGGPSVFGCEMDPNLVDAARARPVTLRPGDVSAHHSNLIHSSGPNRSAHPRRALAIRYRAK
jgi:hypothetical protein